MDLLDVALILLAISVAMRGVAAGLLRQVGALGGFFIGLIAGAALVPVVSKLALSSSTRLIIGLIVFLGTASLLAGLGERLGISLSGFAQRLHLGKLDGVLGAAFGVIVALVTSWLLASSFARLPVPALAAQIQNSAILQTLDRTLPPAPEVLSSLEGLLGSNGFPRVFTGLEPTPAPPVTGPNAAAVNQAAAAGRAATVQIIGLGCGGELEGSGFVSGPGLVTTNAHVVAGIAHPTVVDGAGSHRAQVVVFDPNLDIAVLKTSGLAASPLPIATTVADRGTVGAALGYPGGGPFTVSPAAVLGHQQAIGRNIYDSGVVRRDIFELQAIVRPGNSGGPLVTPDGMVIGVIFATSTVNGNVGYALTGPEVLPDVQKAASSGPVSTGACAAE